MTDVVVFVPYGSRLGFHEDGIAATMAKIDYKFPQCVCFETDRNGNGTVKHMEKTVCVFKERAGCPGGGKGILIGYDHSFTLATNFNGAICYAVDSHPMDSRFDIDGNISPTVTAKLAKGSADGPLVILENE